MGGTNYIRNKNGIRFTPPVVETINNFIGFENVTDDTSELILSSVLIPADSFKLYDIIEIESRIRKNNTNGIVAIRIRIGTGQTTSDTLVATYSSTSATHTFIPIKRTLTIKDLDGTPSGTKTIDASTSVSYDYIYSGFTISDLNINWTLNNYISVTGQMQSLLDEMNCMYIKTKRFVAT